MPSKHNEMNFLLISSDTQRSGKLMQIFEEQGIHGDMRKMRASKSAIACARRLGRYRQNSRHDMVLVDFADPDEKTMAVVRDIALGSDRLECPIILLTSEESEYLLEDDGAVDSWTNMFAPTSLACFLKKMRQHSRSRFLRALNVISNVGPVLVRLPIYFMRDPYDRPVTQLDDMQMRQVA